MAADLLFQQALFGYESGHHLLRASLSLPSTVRHLLAVATDSSGSAPAKGFDVAYTGVPLPGFNFYALFCTWPAPEMPRPGCVWSHVLLIELADLAELPDLGVLRSCFRRPDQDDIDSFAEPLEFYSSMRGKPVSKRVKPVTACEIIDALYGLPDSSMVIPSPDELEFQDFVFAAWSQQWPKLRRSFRFSTGSFADRGRGSAPFDLQITPQSNQRAWSSTKPILVVPVDNTASRMEFATLESWVKTTVTDLLEPDKQGLRTFFRSYGIDVRTPRHAFRSLVKAFELLTFSSADTWTSVLKGIAKEFPHSDEALLLKQASVAIPPNSTDTASEARTWAAVDYLCHEPADGAYSKISYDFGALAPLWSKNQDAVADLLQRPPEIDATERWSSLLKAVSNASVGTDASWLWSKHPKLLPAFVRLNPKLATHEEIWRLPERAQWHVAEALEHQTLSPIEWENIVFAMLSAGTHVATRDIVHCAGIAALSGALTWTQKAGSSLPSPLWRDLLQPMADRRVREEMLPPVTLAFCVALLPPKIAERVSPGRKDIQELAQTPLRDLPEALRLHTAFFLLTLGLQTRDDAGVRLVSHSIFTVHAALSEQRESADSWRLLRTHLPDLYPWDDWDQCKKVRRAVRKWLKDKPRALRLMQEEVQSSADWTLLEKLR